MSAQSEPYIGGVELRALFNATDSAMTRAEINERLGARTAQNQNRIRAALNKMVEKGFATAAGTGAERTFTPTGKVHVPGEAMNVALGAARARVDCMAGMVPAPPAGPAGSRRPKHDPVETVEDFQARGGRIERLPAAWERAA